MLAPINQALAALAQGRMIVVVDDEDRENEGDLLCLADAVTPAHIDPTMAMHHTAWMAMGNQVIDQLPIDLRNW